jgi:O-antigen biosynthesis protein
VDLLSSQGLNMPEPHNTVPLVSVIIPCYNGADYLCEAIDSVLAQNYPKIELIVVDDGSTDESWNVIRSYADRITGIRQHNQGLASTRNNGVARASGEYFHFLDSDDLIAPDTIECLVSVIRGRHDAVSCCPWRNLIRQDNKWLPVTGEVPFPLGNSNPLAAWLLGEWIPVCSLLWPRELFEHLGGYDRQLTTNEDGDLMLRALVRGTKLAVALGGESFYRRHGPSSISMSRDVFSEHRFRSSMHVLEKLEAELQQRQLWEKYRIPLGIAYQALAARTFSSLPDLAREALARGYAYAGRQAIAPTLPGRLLVKLLGMEKKQQIVQALARFGVMSRGRRELLSLKKIFEADRLTRR